MIDSGIEVVIFNPKGLFPYKSLSNFRNHEKLLIVDNEVALYGSANIADEYIRLNTSKTFFTDIQYIVKGQIVTSLATNFFSNYNEFSNVKKHFKDQTNKHLSKYLKENNEYEGNNPMQLVIGAPNYSMNNIANTIKLSINAARKSIKIICPFFSPTDDILSCIYAASMRGVKVEIILPSKNSETIYALTMNRSLYSNLLKNNVKVYEHYSFIHAKLMIFDDELVMFGSNNLDYRSLIINFENAILFEGKKNVKEFVELFDKILEQTKTVDEKYIKKHYTLKNKILSKLLLTYKPLI
jgi:cardiolipin synthase